MANRPEIPNEEALLSLEDVGLGHVRGGWKLPRSARDVRLRDDGWDDAEGCPLVPAPLAAAASTVGIVTGGVLVSFGSHAHGKLLEAVQIGEQYRGLGLRGIAEFASRLELIDLQSQIQALRAEQQLRETELTMRERARAEAVAKRFEIYDRKFAEYDQILRERPRDPVESFRQIPLVSPITKWRRENEAELRKHAGKYVAIHPRLGIIAASEDFEVVDEALSEPKYADIVDEAVIDRVET
jgi:hypothetical protein